MTTKGAGFQQTTILDAAFSRASTSAARYVADSNVENTEQLNESLSELLRQLGSIEVSARLSLKNRHVSELLGYSPHILSASTTNLVTRSRFHRLLFNIGLYNVTLRRYMACELEMCSSVFVCLKVSLRNQLGPQNLIDILRLIQVLAYEKTVTLGVWTNELISFLISEVVREPEQEWMPYCMVILCNLATRSKSVCNRIKKSSSYKPFSRRVMALLSHDARIVVVSSLVLIGYLEEKVRDMVYCTQNIHETFQCVFNVLIMGDTECLMTRHIAADLLRRLVVSDTPTMSSTPVLATTGKDLVNYSFFPKCIEQTAELLVFLKPQLEESTKVYDLLLSFCTVVALRSPVCSAIVRCPPTKERLTTPILAIASTASLSPDDTIDPEVPLRALRLLAYLLKEIIETNERIVPFLPMEQLVALIESCVSSSSFDTSRDDFDYECRRLQLGLRLAEVCSQDEDVRNELFEVVSAQMCSSIAEFQLLQNPVGSHLSKPPSHRNEPIAKWSINGVGVLLELSRLLASLKDHSKLHKDQYWRMLKDDRLIPFLAFAIVHGENEMVHLALLAFKHCSQVHAFPTHLLAEFVASCSTERKVQFPHHEASVNSSHDGRYQRSKSPECGLSVDSKETAEKKAESQKAIDELLRKISTGFELKDLKTSEILSAYENKISVMQNQIRGLEALLDAKNQALTESEKLRVQLRNGVAGGYTAESDMHQVRSLVQECENLREVNVRLSAQSETAKKSSEDRMAFLRDELAKSQQERDGLAAEMEQERALVLASRAIADDLKKKLEIASSAALDRQNEILSLTREKSDLAGVVHRLRSDIDALKTTHRKEEEKMCGDMAKQAANVERLIREKNEQQQRIEGRELEIAEAKQQCAQLEAKVTFKEKELTRLNSQYQQLDSRCLEKEKERAAYLAELESERGRCQSMQIELDKMRRMREEFLRLANGC